ncbi:hypothetical protein ANCCEY_00750 [Ancylostoma ceylanicum]|uniref:Uncharacterized protein n=1 Tax=Ancylostoma ceylanicum TaxID=53326 RepID=A0A0D6M7U9_9BILA|nr:hypothetical protein ANCCEY_00750 [Ancylostoma ceylanicum]
MALSIDPEDEEYFDATDYDSPNDVITSSNTVTRFLDKHLVWKSSSDDYNDRWKREFLKQPSWCDADLCLQQIKRQGKMRMGRHTFMSFTKGVH